MGKTVYDVRQFLDDKRIYMSLKGHELDFTFRPVAIDEMYKKYTKLEADVATAIYKVNKKQQEYFDKLKGLTDPEEIDKIRKEGDEDTVLQDLKDLSIEARDAGINFICVAAQANQQESVTPEWINKELDPREFGYIIRFIMGTENPEELKKK